MPGKTISKMRHRGDCVVCQYPIALLAYRAIAHVPMGFYLHVYFSAVFGSQDPVEIWNILLLSKGAAYSLPHLDRGSITTFAGGYTPMHENHPE